MTDQLRRPSKTFWISSLFIVIGTLAGGLLLPSKDRVSLAVFDFLQSKTLLQEQSQVALITVDQASLDRLAEEGLVFPLPRQIYGTVAQLAADYSAKMVVYDILFTEPSSYGESDDRLFAQLIRDSRIPVFFPAASPSGKTKQPIPVLKDAAAGLGSVNNENDSDGVFRRYLGGNSLANEIFKTLRPQEIPSPPEYLHYYQNTSFPNTSLYNILKTYRQRAEGQPVSVDLSELKNRIWIVGYTASGLYDLKPIPANPRAPGVLIPATAIANVMHGHGLVGLPVQFGALLCFLAALASLFLVRMQKGPLWAGTGLLTLGVLIPIGLSFASWLQGYWQSPVPLALSALISGGGGTIWVFQTVWRNQLRFARMVQHAMSPAMVDLIRRGEVTVSRFGETREISVVFTDLVGFTELSERLSPEQLVAILNGYFDEVVHVVTEASGYVDKFIGDSVMAVWGAPVQQKDHASLALSAALNLCDAVERYNQHLARLKPNLNPLGTRIGLHSGSAVVGNIGARHRHNYTAVGDTVNLSARLEGLCKSYGVDIIISEDCLIQAEALNRSGIVELDQVMVKGKSQATRIYTYSRTLTSELAQQYREGLNLYYKGQWMEALRLLENLQFPPAQLMASRCRRAIEKGQLEQWNMGVWTYDTK